MSDYNNNNNKEIGQLNSVRWIIVNRNLWAIKKKSPMFISNFKRRAFDKQIYGKCAKEK